MTTEETIQQLRRRLQNHKFTLRGDVSQEDLDNAVHHVRRFIAKASNDDAKAISRLLGQFENVSTQNSALREALNENLALVTERPKPKPPTTERSRNGLLSPDWLVVANREGSVV